MDGVCIRLGLDSAICPGGGSTPIITPTGMCPKFGCLFQRKILLLGMKFG